MRRREDLASLASAAAAGDRRAWDVLAERLVRLSWRVCRAYELPIPEARRTCRVVWLRFADRVATDTASADPAAWIFEATAHECRMVRAATELPENSRSAERGVDEAMQHAYDALSLRDRLLLTLLADGAFTYREVADVLGMPVGSIGPTRRRTLQRLRRVTETRT